jgi:hypothetical protein
MKTIDEYEKLAAKRIFEKYPDGTPINIMEITQTTTQLIMIDLGKVILKNKKEEWGY